MPEKRKITRKSDIRSVRNIAEDFLYLEIAPTEIPMIVCHPFFSSSTYYLAKDRKWVDLLNDKDGLRYVQEVLTELIQKSDIETILLGLIRKPYRLTFLKYIKNYLSPQDFSRFLAEAYLDTEFPSSDANVSLATLKRWFIAADKQYLMNEREYHRYLSIPEKLKVYRGITDLKGAKGLSWTNDMQTALKFAKRYREKGAVVLTADINKSEIIACFDRANEKEIICQPKNYIIQEV